MRLETFIAFRYLLAKNRKANLVSIISFLSILGIFLGVMVPIIVISVMSGFQNEIREKIIGMSFHVVIQPGNIYAIDEYRELTKELSSEKDIVLAAPFIETQGMVRYQDSYLPVRIRAVEPDLAIRDREFSSVFRITEGSGDFSRRYSILAGSELAKRNWLIPGSRLEVWAVKSTFNPLSRPKVFQAEVSGFFKTGYYEYDSAMLYTSIATLKKALASDNSVISIGIKIKNIYRAEEVAGRLIAKYQNRYRIFTWQDANRNLFKALATEKLIMWVIVVLILVVAIFNVMSSQIMLVIEKKKEIGILKTMGMQPGHIMKIFLFEGMFIAMIGSLLGSVCGLLFASHIKETMALIESIVNFFINLHFSVLSAFYPVVLKPEAFYLFPQGVYYLDRIPVDINPLRTLLVIFFALALSALAGLIPSWAASRLRPVDVIRYE
ncbi:MAG: hypothetical protein A2096_11680 [Spirochaetes bacterium GWF1_41_5]|nr:MAG: hypothetical protein A2096_11680 [Spirochaetes bacterium GWF1_41_5]HBE03466.1 hypothetical protein [Spirochaetia bacterium]